MNSPSLSLACSPSFFLSLAINELPHAQKMIRMQTKTRHNPKCDRKFVFIVYNFCVFNRNRRSPWHLVKWCLFGCVQTGSVEDSYNDRKREKTNAIRMGIAWITVVHTFLGDFFLFTLFLLSQLQQKWWTILSCCLRQATFFYSLFFFIFIWTYCTNDGQTLCFRVYNKWGVKIKWILSFDPIS